MSTVKVQDIASIFKALSSDHALSLLRAIAIERREPDVLRANLKLSTKQYYSRISTLSKANLVHKKGGFLTLTSFGKLVYESHLTIEKGLEDLSKLKVIDSLESSSGLSKEERDNIVSILLQNREIKTVLERKS
jgi:predicted transcriptional regulator